MTCPNFQSTDIIPITYGTPPLSGARLVRAIESKEIILGGCYLCGDAPKWYCRSCEHRFHDQLPKKSRLQRK